MAQQLPPRIKQELAKLGAEIKALQPTVKHSVSAESGTILELSARGDVAKIRQITQRTDLRMMDRFR